MTVGARSAKGGDYNRRMSPGLAAGLPLSPAGKARAPCQQPVAPRNDPGPDHQRARAPFIMTAHYQLLVSEADYRQACDTILSRAEREILIFDRDLTALRC